MKQKEKQKALAIVQITETAFLNLLPNCSQIFCRAKRNNKAEIQIQTYRESVRALHGGEDGETHSPYVCDKVLPARCTTPI